MQSFISLKVVGSSRDSYPRAESLKYAFKYTAVLHSYVTGRTLREREKDFVLKTYKIRKIRHKQNVFRNVILPKLYQLFGIEYTYFENCILYTVHVVNSNYLMHLLL